MNKQLVFASIPTAISVLALIFTAFQTYDAHQQAKMAEQQAKIAEQQNEGTRAQLEQQKRQFAASVKPLVTFDVEDEPDDPRFGVWIENRGNGPAIIKSVTYYVDGKAFTDVDGAIAAAHLNADETDYFTFDPDDPLGVTERDQMLYRVKKFAAHKKEAQRFADAIDQHFNIAVEFCSIVDECAKRCSLTGPCP